MKTYIKNGFWYKTNKPNKGELSFEKIIKDTLFNYNVPVTDPCCPALTVAMNASGTITAANLHKRIITSTSAAATNITLPTTTLLAAELGANKGTWFEFTVDNMSGASVVTLVPGTGTTAIVPVITGGATLTVAAATVGLFKIYFTSTTTAKIARIV